ncbi:MAG: hypothetical protein R3C56_20500 [Pirellulaceae bacterium]
MPDKPTRNDAQEAVGELLGQRLPVRRRQRPLSVDVISAQRNRTLGNPWLRSTVQHHSDYEEVARVYLPTQRASLPMVRGPARRSPQTNNEQRRRSPPPRLGLFMMLLDNVDCLLGGSSLDAALTATTWTDRILGASKTTRSAARAIWTATGNNLRFGSEELGKARIAHPFGSTDPELKRARRL